MFLASADSHRKFWAIHFFCSIYFTNSPGYNHEKQSLQVFWKHAYQVVTTRASQMVKWMCWNLQSLNQVKIRNFFYIGWQHPSKFLTEAQTAKQLTSCTCFFACTNLDYNHNTLLNSQSALGHLGEWRENRMCRSQGSKHTQIAPMPPVFWLSRELPARAVYLFLSSANKVHCDPLLPSRQRSPLLHIIRLMTVLQ